MRYKLNCTSSMASENYSLLGTIQLHKVKSLEIAQQRKIDGRTSHKIKANGLQLWN